MKSILVIDKNIIFIIIYSIHIHHWIQIEQYMKKLYKIFLFTFVVAVILIICFFFALSNSYITSNYLLNAVNKTLKINLKAEEVKISLLDSYIELNDFSFYEKDNPVRIDHGKRIYINYKLIDLFSGIININKIEFDELDISISKPPKFKNASLRTGIIKHLKKKIIPHSFVKFDINNIRFRDLNLNIQTEDSSSIILKNADIFIPKLADFSMLDLLLTNAKLTIITNNKLNLNINMLNIQIKTHLKKRLTPTDIATLITAKDIKGKIKDKEIKIPKLVIKTSIEHNENSLQIKNINISEFSKEINKKATNLNINGDVSLKPLSFMLTVNADPISSNILSLFSNYTFNKTYNNTELKYSGKIKYNNNKISSDGNLFIKNLIYSPFNKANIEPLKVDLEYKFDFKQNNRDLNIDKFLLKIKNETKELLGINLKNKLSASLLKNNFKIHSTKSNLSIKVNELNLNNIKNFLPSRITLPLKQITGNISSELNISVAKNNKINALIKTHINDLYLKMDKRNINLENINILDMSEFTINNFFDISIKKNQISISDGRKLLLSGSVTGNYFPTKEEGDLSVRISKFYKEAINLFPFTSDNKKILVNQLNKFENYYLKIDNKIRFKKNIVPILLDRLKLELYNNKNKKTASVELKIPIQIKELKKNYLLSGNPFEFLLNFNTFDLNLLSPFFDNYNIAVKNGKLTGNINVSSDKNNENMQIVGNYVADAITFFYNNKKFNNITIEQSINMYLQETGIIKMNNLKSLLKIDNNKLLSFGLIGDFSKNSNLYHLIIKDFFLSAEEINKLPIVFFKKILGINSLELTGSINLSKKEIEKETTAITNLKISNLSFDSKENTTNMQKLNGDLNANFLIGKESIDFNKFSLSLAAEKEHLGRLKGSGKIFTPLTSGRSNIKLSLSDLKLKKIISQIKKNKHNINTNFRGIDYSIDLTADNISYGDQLYFNLNTHIAKDESSYSIRPIMADINNTNIFATLNCNTGINSKESFKITASFSNMNIAPFLKMYKPLIYNNATGIINDFTLELYGKNFTRESLKKNLNGNLKASVNHLSFNDNLVDFDVPRLLFLPFEILTQTEQLLSNYIIPDFLNNLIGYSKRIFSNTEKLQFNLGELDLNVNNGIIYLKKCYFEGNDDSFDSLNFNGSISLNEDINVNAYIKLNNLITLPINISGKISKPNPNIIDLTSFIKRTLLTSFKQDAVSLIKVPEYLLTTTAEDSTMIIETVMP